MHRQLSTIIRAAVLLMGAACGGTAAYRLAAPPAAVLVTRLLADGPDGLRGLAFEAALTGLCAAVLLGCLLWLALLSVLSVTAYVARELAPGSGPALALGRAVDRGCPAAVGRLVAAALGVAVSVGAAGPALGGPMPGHPGGATTHGAARTMPDRLGGLRCPTGRPGPTGGCTHRWAAPPGRGPARVRAAPTP